jgi:hypothetical protein
VLSDPRAASVPGLQDLELMHPARTLLGDMYVAFRLLFVATMTPVSAMLVANAKGVQVGARARAAGVYERPQDSEPPRGWLLLKMWTGEEVGGC